MGDQLVMIQNDDDDENYKDTEHWWLQQSLGDNQFSHAPAVTFDLWVMIIMILIMTRTMIMIMFVFDICHETQLTNTNTKSWN